MGRAAILSLVSMSGREPFCLSLQHGLLWKPKPRKALKVTQYTNSAPENDSRLTSDASVLERTEQKRVKGRNDPGSLEICVTEHQPLGMFSVYLGRVQLNLGC